MFIRISKSKRTFIDILEVASKGLADEDFKVTIDRIFKGFAGNFVEEISTHIGEGIFFEMGERDLNELPNKFQ